MIRELLLLLLWEEVMEAMILNFFTDCLQLEFVPIPRGRDIVAIVTVVSPLTDVLVKPSVKLDSAGVDLDLFN